MLRPCTLFVFLGILSSRRLHCRGKRREIRLANSPNSILRPDAANASSRIKSAAFVQDVAQTSHEDVGPNLLYFWIAATAVFLFAAVAVVGLYARRKNQEKEDVKKTDEEGEEDTFLEADISESDEEAEDLQCDFEEEKSDASSWDGVFNFALTFKAWSTSPHWAPAQNAKARMKRFRHMFKTRWLRETKSQRVVANAQYLFFLSILLIVFRNFRHVDMDADLSLKVESIVLAILVCGSLWCMVMPSSEVYWSIFFIYCFYIFAVPLPPLSYSCKELYEYNAQNNDWYMLQLQDQVDCSTQGITAQSLLIGFFVFLPWLVPRFSILQRFACIGGFVYVAWTILYSAIMGEIILRSHEFAAHAYLLCALVAVSIVKKFYLEKSQRTQFVQDLRLRYALQKVFTYLQYMVPQHVIAPMIAFPDKSIAESVDCASILFIVIADFERHAKQLDPNGLLSLLNKTFSAFDAICDHAGVTKIESIGEEYVACVGVLPCDIAVSQSQGHAVLLKRLFLAADEILQMQTETMTFKMGMHSGPVDAGVIAGKLPRYRLFGDTINTAARMMQKSTVGKLQFGEETRQRLPLSIHASHRGKVEMKGKGQVDTYVFDGIVGNEEPEKDVVTKPTRGICDLYRAEYGNVDSDTGTITMTFSDLSIGSSFSHHMSKELDDIMDKVSLQRKEFTPDMERDWCHQDHKARFCNKIRMRYLRQMVGLAVGTLLELCYFGYEMVVVRGQYTTSGMHVFWYFRVVILLSLWLWHSVVAPSDWLSQDPHKSQYLAVATACASALLCFFSYEGLIANKSNAEVAPPFRQEDNVRMAPFAQFFTLHFMVAFYLIIGNLHVRFKPSLSFVLLAFLVIGISYLRRQQGVFVPFQCMILFLSIAVTNSVIAYATEQSSRAHFEANEQAKFARNKIEGILNTLLPPLVVAELRKKPINMPPPSHVYQHATIAQSDLCGFTKLASTRTPAEVVEFMSVLFGEFDRLVDVFEIYKVETVGDAYIAGTAEKPLTTRNCPVRVIKFGLEMTDVVKKWASSLGFQVNCRVGVHHGSCAGGIVGTGMQRYHLFGDLLHGVEVLESTAPEGNVQVSSACKEIVEQPPSWSAHEIDAKFSFIPRGETELCTSKGELHSYDEVGGRTFVISPHRDDDIVDI